MKEDEEGWCTTPFADVIQLRRVLMCAASPGQQKKMESSSSRINPAFDQ